MQSRADRFTRFYHGTASSTCTVPDSQTRSPGLTQFIELLYPPSTEPSLAGNVAKPSEQGVDGSIHYHEDFGVGSNIEYGLICMVLDFSG